MKKWKAALLLVFGIMTAVLMPVLAEEVKEETEEEAQLQTEEADDGIWNLLLIGSDRRSSDWNGNSDTMILLTVNEQTQTAYLVSFMRDTAAAIPGYGTRKLNAAYALGGASLLEETLVSNFGVQIDNYAAVDFEGIVAIIDELGGVDIEQSAEEIKVTNGYVNSLCSLWGLNVSDYTVYEGQTHLNGLQALAYMRDRYVGMDYERTARQRKVLTALLDQTQLSDVESLLSLVKTMLSYVDTDMDLADMLYVARLMPQLSDYEIVTDRVPYDGLYSSSNEMLYPVQPDTNDRLLTLLYGQSE